MYSQKRLISMTRTILIIDDDSSICEILEFNLKNEGFDVVVANSAEEGFDKLSPSTNLILLDVMMGGMSGYKMAEKLRTSGNQTPIIFLTAKDTENDMLTAFSVGADDYISKPFSIKEVIARAKAVLNRNKVVAKAEPKSSNIVFDDLVINIDQKELVIKGEIVRLTKTEFEILVLLAQHEGHLFSREDIINSVWKETPYITERTVDVHITRMRKKLGEYAAYITNRTGYGYRFNTPGV